jgi:hypothetical protein
MKTAERALLTALYVAIALAVVGGCGGPATKDEPTAPLQTPVTGPDAPAQIPAFQLAAAL